LVSAFGVIVLVALAWAVSRHRRQVNWRTVGWGLALQLLFGVLVLKTAPGRWVFEVASDAIRGLISFTDRGAEFIWGPLYRGVPGNYENPAQQITLLFNPETGAHEPMGFVFLLNALMPIIFFASLMAVLYHLGVMKWIIMGFARVMKKFMGTSGAETLSASANIFVGQTEAPLVIKPFVDTMTKSELHAVMAGGFATVAGGVMAAYTTFGIDPGHLLAASVMSAPAALVAAKLFLPETEESMTAGEMKLDLEKSSANVLDAACTGAAEGLKLVGNVAAMLLAFIALIALVDWFLGAVDQLLVVRLLGFEPLGLSLASIFGVLFFPVAVLLGVPWQDCDNFGSLLGTRMAINEFVAYLQLAAMESKIEPRTFVLATYAFCGFANFSSIAIQIGGIGGIAPQRKSDLARLGVRAMFAGTLASFLTAGLVGTLLNDDEIAYRHYARQSDQFLGERYQQKVDLFERFKEDYPDSSYLEEVDARITRYTGEASARLSELKKAHARAEAQGMAAEARQALEGIRTIGTPQALDEVRRIEGEAPPPAPEAPDEGVAPKGGEPPADPLGGSQ